MCCVSEYPAKPEDYSQTLEFISFWVSQGFKFFGVSDHLGPNNAFDLSGLFYEFHFDAFPELGETPDAPVSKGIEMASKITRAVPNNPLRQINTTHKRIGSYRPIPNGFHTS